VRVGDPTVAHVDIVSSELVAVVLFRARHDLLFR
jgi:hypothetical protein